MGWSRTGSIVTGGRQTRFHREQVLDRDLRLTSIFFCDVLRKKVGNGLVKAFDHPLFQSDAHQS